MSKALGIIGFWSFIIGLIIAVVMGIVAPDNDIAIIVLLILGIIIGFLNISAREVPTLLLATIALIVVGGVFSPLNTMGLGAILDNMLAYVATLVAPAAVIAAVKALWAVGKPGMD